MSETLTFDNLIGDVKNIHDITNTYAKGAVNQLLTIRNWMIGYYIVEFEQQGKDRAKYGTHLLKDIALRIDIKGIDHQFLSVCRTFYIRYPQICETVSRKLEGIGGGSYSSIQDANVETKSEKLMDTEICATLSHKFETPPEMLISRLSFSHIREIMKIEDPLERFFYEMESIKCQMAHYGRRFLRINFGVFAYPIVPRDFRLHGIIGGTARYRSLISAA